MDSFVPQAAQGSSPDPMKHVNYTLGMVLGVDDFTQEFAYLSGRDRRIVRDLLGYGTVSGLHVRLDGENNNPRIVVEAGVAVSPGGQVIRVTPAQCAMLSDWVRENQAIVKDNLNSGKNDDLGKNVLSLYVVLCYRDCPVDMVPIPGEPCRTEEDSMAASRLKDDFRLELRADSPYQIEEVALRDFVAWMRKSIELTNTPGTFLKLPEFIEEIRSAVLIPGSPPDWPPASPPHLPPDFMKDLPAMHLRVRPLDACRYLNAAFRLWVTELRHLWRPTTLGETNPCCADQKEEDPTDEDCVLLAQLNIAILEDKLSGKLLIDGGKEVQIDEEQRPILAHQRFLQEWLLCEPKPEVDGKVVAAGRFDVKGTSFPTPLFSFNLAVTPFGDIGQNFYFLKFKGYNPRIFYVVKGTPIAQGGSTETFSFEVIPTDDPIFKNFSGKVPLKEGIVVRVRQGAKGAAQGFMVEISQY